MQKPIRERISVGGGGGQAKLELYLEIVLKKLIFIGNDCKKINKTIGFTLAEVFITLGIIGIVAAMTLPVLVNKSKDRELEVRTKKTFSEIEQAALFAQQKLGCPGDHSCLFNPLNTSEEVTKNFAQYFNGAKYCEPGANAKGCKNLHYKIKYNSILQNASTGNAGVTSIVSYPRIVLNDGAVIAVQQYTEYKQEATCNTFNPDGSLQVGADGKPIERDCSQYRWATIYFDVNGNLAPNQFGRDAFTLYVRDRIIPDPTWTQGGGESLRSILSGGGAIYKNYSEGQPFEW